MSRGGVLLEPLVVVEQVPVPDVCELALEAALGFLRCLELRDLAFVVVTSRSDVAGLNDGCGVQRGVQLAVSRSVESMRRMSPLDASTGAVPV